MAEQDTLNQQDTMTQQGAVQTEQLYLDVAVVRVQEWLSRTASLRFRRGASILLDEVTSESRWRQSLPAGTEWNDEAGDVSGVVALRLLAGQPEATLRAAAQVMISELRALLPHATFEAVAGAGHNYAEAYVEMKHRRARGELLARVPAPPTEIVVGKPCEACLQAVATAVRTIVGERRALCAECARRAERAGSTTSAAAEQAPRSERRVLEAVRHGGHEVEGFADTIEDIARAGSRSVDDSSTHVALINADGNGVGVFMERVAAAKGHVSLRTSVVRELTSATRTALAAAAARTLADSADAKGRWPLLVHVVGGDDIVVSVPAGSAWPFVRVLIEEFHDTLRQRAEEQGWSVSAEEIPTLSAGVVFHHLSQPFWDAVHHADEQLKTAKITGRGRGAYVAFTDLTAYGPASTPRVRSVRDLADEEQLLSHLAAVPAAHRVTLIRALDDVDALGAASGSPGSAGSSGSSGSSGSPGTDDAESPLGALARRIVGRGYAAAREAAGLPDTADLTQATQILAVDENRRLLRLRLEQARWWPPADEGDAR